MGERKDLSVVGYGETVITPRGTVRFGITGDVQLAAVHDDLYAHVLCLEDSENRVLLVSLDMLGVDLGFTQQVRKVLSRAVGVTADQVMITATHAHTVPYGIPLRQWAREQCDDEVIQYRAQVVQTIRHAAKLALEDRSRCTIGFAKTVCLDLSSNRRRVDGPTDPDVHVAFIKDVAGHLKAVVVGHACHATVMHTTGLVPCKCEISADFPGELKRQLREAIGIPDLGVMFLNGAAGDLSTRYTRREHSYSELSRLTRFLTQSVMELIGRTPCHPIQKIQGVRASITLSRRALPPERELLAAINDTESSIEAGAVGSSYADIKKKHDTLWGLRRLLDFTRCPGPADYATEFQILSMNDDTLLVGMPGEPLCAVGKRIKSFLPSKHLWPVGYSNDYVGYLVPYDEMPFGGYEAAASRIDPCEVERLVGEIERVLSIERKNANA